MYQANKLQLRVNREQLKFANEVIHEIRAQIMPIYAVHLCRHNNVITDKC